ncbi:MAG: hypothetical protein PHG85_05355 [Candidatus Altiarchaeota archaeon]|nr:hypothetical protein [Candidatus Altiarchaeota archaeon]
MTKKKRSEQAGIASRGNEARLDLRKTCVIGLIVFSALLFFYNAFSLMPGESPTSFDRVKTLALFAVMTYGIGGTLLGAVRMKPEDPVERLFMTFGIGLVALPILTILLDLVGLPLDATLLLCLSLLYPIYSLATGKSGFKIGGWKISEALDGKGALAASVVLLFAMLYFSVLMKGAMSAPYLEDDDSWEHAVGVKYVSMAKTYSIPDGVTIRYMGPYPPAYDGLLGILHQYNDSVYWTMKFFNALLIGMSIITAYYFIRLFTGDEKVALGGAFVLTVTPCYLSHFIWAHVLGHVLFYPALYAVEMSGRDKRWGLIAVMAVASMMVVQPLVSLVFGILYLLYYAVRAIFEKRLFKRFLAVGAIGLLTAAAVFWIPLVFKYGSEGVNNAAAPGLMNAIQKGDFRLIYDLEFITLDKIMLVEPYSGAKPEMCATLVPGKYCIPLYGNIAIQKGFGAVIFPLFAVSAAILLLRYRKETEGGAYWVPVSLLWGLFTFIGLEAGALPIGVDPPRFFMFMTLPMAILIPKGVLIIADMLKRYAKPEYVIAVLVVAVLYTSAYPKYVVQTAMWPFGVMWSSMEQVQGYSKLRTSLPANAMVYPMCLGDRSVIGLDKMSIAWDKEVLSFRDGILDRTPEDIYRFLKGKGYEYAILDVSCLVACDKEMNNTEYCLSKVNKMAADLSKNGGFSAASSNNAMVLFKLK